MAETAPEKSGKQKILVVDDDPIFLRLVGKVLIADGYCCQKK